MDTNKVYEVLDTAKSAFEALSATLREVIGQMRDVQAENEQLHSTNQRLSDDNNTLRTRQHEIEGELFSARQEARQAVGNYENLKSDMERRNTELDKALDECRKLREVILNVAAATDAIVNPKAPEVVKAPEPVQTEAGTQAPGSVSVGLADTSRW